METVFINKNNLNLSLSLLLSLLLLDKNPGGFDN